MTVGDESVDLSELMERTHFAFESIGDALVGGDDAYRVSVNGDGIAFAPDDASRTRHEKADPIHLRTAAISRDGAALMSAPAAYSRERDGTLAAELSDGVREFLENTHAGLEQSWHFDAAPSGAGDLRVEVAVNGESLVAATTTGLHFSDPTSGLGTVYGAARWIDATGTTTDLAIRYDHGAINIAVPARLLEESAYPAVLDPTIGPEYSIDSPILGPAADVQRAPAVGHPGTVNAEYTVVWQDRRRTLDMTYDIYMASVSRSGVVQTPVGAPVNPLSEGGDHLSPAIEKNIVVYASNATADGFYGIFAKNLSTGTVAEIGIPDHSAFNDCSVPKISSVNDANNGGEMYAVLWRELSHLGGNGQVLGDVINPALQVVTQKQALSPSFADANFPAIAGQATSASPKFLAVWSDNWTGSNTTLGHYNIKGALLPSSFGSFTSVTVSTGNSFNASHPSVAPFGGTTYPYDGFIVAWDRPTSTNILSPNYDVFAAGVNPAGAVQSFTLPNGDHDQRFPAVAGFGADGSLPLEDVLVVWDDNRDGINHAIRGTRVDMRGLPWKPTAYDTATVNFQGQYEPSGGPAVSSDPTSGYFAVWADARVPGQYFDIYGGNLSYAAPQNATVSNYRISSSVNRESSPAVSKCGSNYLVAWSDSRSLATDDYDLYGAILNASGTPVTSSFAISTAPGAQDFPTIGCSRNTSTFFVAWVDQRNGNSDIYGTQVLNNGTVVSPAGLALAASSATETYPSIADDGAGHLWLTFDSGSNTVWGTQFDPTGVVAVPPTPLITDGTNADLDYDPATGSFLIAYQWFQSSLKNYDIFGAPMTLAGAVSPPFAIEQGGADQRYPRVRFDQAGGTALVAYEDDRNISLSGTDIFGHRVNTTSSQPTAIALASSSASERSPRLTMRSGTVAELTYWSAAGGTQFDYDVYGCDVNAGAPGAPFAISTTAGVREMTPGIACDATTCVVPYRSYDPNDQTTGADRVKARVLGY